jgi:hypothetical protein
MQQTIIRTLAIVGIACATSLLGSVTSASSSIAKNGNQLRDVDGMAAVLNFSSETNFSSTYLMTSHYLFGDTKCKTMEYMEGVKLGACVATSSTGFNRQTIYTVTTVTAGMINTLYYSNSNCFDDGRTSSGAQNRNDGFCRSNTIQTVSTKPVFPPQGYLTRSVDIICS